MADEITKVETDLKLKVTVTKDLGIDGTTNPTIAEETATSAKADYSPTSPVPMTKSWIDTRSFTTSETLDLTALPQANFTADVDFTGLKVQAIKIVAASANTNPITFKDGATNGYNIFGDASGQITLLAGGKCLMVFNDNLDDVAAADLAIDVSATGTQAYDIQMVAG